MKNILICFLGGFLLILAACDPIEKRNELGAVLSVDQIQATVENTTSGGNQLVLKNITPNTGGVWDYKIGKSFKQVDTITFPLLGKHVFKFSATTSGGVVVKEIEVNINQIDNAIDPNWTNLAGTTAEGKRWVYATDRPGWDAGEDPYPPFGYCFMVASSNWEEFWWDPYEGTEGPLGVDSEMNFDLNNGTNYTYFANESATGEKGAFVLDLEKMTIHIKDPYILDYDEPNLNPDVINSGDYLIKSLTENELILYQEQYADDYGWIWIFKPKGYIYPSK